MSGSSAPARKTLERLALLEFVKKNGRAADMPCTPCWKNKTTCVMSEERSNRCLECIRHPTRKCDGVLVASSLRKVLDQQQKLEKEEEEASDDLLALHEKMAELQSSLAAAAGRLSRIRKIRARAKAKGSELFQRGMEELDKEDGLLPALDSHEHFVVEDLQSMGVSNEVDWSSLGFGSDFVDLGPLVETGDTGQERRSPQHAS